MGDGLSIGKTWTVQVPDSVGRTVSQNLWQYSLFPMATSPSVMYPCDGLSNLNDAALMKFDFDTTNFLDTSTKMFYQLMPMVKQWMAQQAEIYQKTMQSISGNTNINIKKAPEAEDPAKIDGKKEIKEEEINATINKMATDPKTAARMNRKVTYTDKNGKEITDKTLLQRLIQLSKEYQENPDKPETIEISKENYELLWDIAGKYAKTGELSREDYAKLIEIATNPGGPGAYKKDKEDDKEKTGVRPEKYQAVLDNTEAMNYYKKLSAAYKEALYNGDATEETLAELTKDTNKYNILEVYKDFNKNYGSLEDENLIDAIFDDTTRWGKTRWTDRLLSDDAKPSITSLSDALIARTNDVIKNNPKLAKEDVDALKAKIEALQNALNGVEYKSFGWSYKTPTNNSTKAISTSFKALADALDAVETNVYGEIE